MVVGGMMLSLVQVDGLDGLFQIIAPISKMSTWYGKSTSKQIQSLLQSKPRLHQLLAVNDFLQQLKNFNSKLLQYITNNPSLISEAITYLTLPPQPSDSNDRKFKLPLQAIELVQTQTICILNGFFKEGEGQQLNFDMLLGMLEQQEILPLLAGYFFRANLCLLNNKYKQTLDRVYARPKVFQQLINHSHHMAISNSIQLFLNLDINKTGSSQPERLAVKLDVVRAIMDRIKEERRKNGPDSGAIVQNLSSILIQTIDKYYLIVDGKQMIQAITDQDSIRTLMELVNDHNDLSFPGFNFFISLINYYSFSSFNAEDANASAETTRRNAEKLEKEPMILEMMDLFGSGMEKVMACPRMDIYHFKLLEVLCHCISIASARIFRRICEVKFFASLISLLFKHENCNILHMLVQKSFYHIFISERKIYEDYKHHLFCQLDIIELTASRILRMLPEHNFLQQASKKAYFGHFMRILKIYSGIQPTDEKIIAAIKAKTSTWNKISELLIKPYENICFKELGSYDNVPTPITQEYNVQRNTNLNPLPQNNTDIRDIQEGELFPHNDKKPQEKIEENHNYHVFDHEPATLKIKDHMPTLTDTKDSKSTSSKDTTGPSKDLKKTDSYQEFINKQKKEAGQSIKNRRSLSQEKKLSSNSRGKMTSPSPNKRDKWKTTKDQKEDKPHHKDEVGIPKGPHSKRSGGPAHSTSVERENRHMQEEKHSASGKSLNLQDLKKMKVIQIENPKEKKYRRASQKDQVFLDFLGISL